MAIKRRKSTKQLWFSEKIPVVNKSRLDIFVWKNREALVENVPDADMSFRSAFAQNGYNVKAGKFYPRTIIGELHFVRGELGPGVYIHELTHAILWLAYILQFDLIQGDKEMEEKLADIAGQVTLKFLLAFLKRLIRIF